MNDLRELALGVMGSTHPTHESFACRIEPVLPGDEFDVTVVPKIDIELERLILAPENARASIVSIKVDGEEVQLAMAHVNGVPPFRKVWAYAGKPVTLRVRNESDKTIEKYGACFFGPGRFVQ